MDADAQGNARWGRNVSLTSIPAPVTAAWLELERGIDDLFGSVLSRYPDVVTRRYLFGATPSRHYGGGADILRNPSLQIVPDLWIDLNCGRPDDWPVNAPVPHLVRFSVAASGEGDLVTLPDEELPPLSDPEAHEDALRGYLQRARAAMSDSTDAILDALQRVFAEPPEE